MERMDDFFASRADIYDEHMLSGVGGCREGYMEMARLLPQDVARLLDLGCGTGLELEEIFKRNPDVAVVGIDLTQAMLDRLAEKYSDRNITLICASYFDCELGRATFDAAVSFQTMHHFPHEDKAGLYRKIYHALKPGGRYVECDYMVLEQAEEEFFLAENRRIRKEMGIAENECYHYDMPCTTDRQTKLLQVAGFGNVRQAWRKENTTILVAVK